MIQSLLILGLVAIPFYELIIYLLIPDTIMPPFRDTRLTKEYISLGFALALGLWAFWKDGLKPVDNKWVFIFIGFSIINVTKMPNIDMPFLGMDISGFWLYKPWFIAIIYLFMLCAIAQSRLKTDLILKIIGYCGVGMAGYVMLQYFGLDQIFHRNSSPAVKSANLGGFLGQPTLVTPFLLMAIPFIKNYFLIALVVTSILMCGSDFGLVGLGICLLACLWKKFPKARIALVVVGTVSLLAVLFLMFHVKQNQTPRSYLMAFSDNGRLDVWKNIITDVHKGQHVGIPYKIGTTGAGLGSFEYLFPLMHDTKFINAHNEYLELLYNCGYVGLFIFLAAVVSFFDKVRKNINRNQVFRIGLSVFLILFCAAGSFILHLAVYQFYLVVLVGLIYQIKGERNV